MSRELAHIVKGQYGEFCMVRGGPKCSCPDKSNYRKCDPKCIWDGVSLSFLQGTKRIAPAGYQAHHAVCVSSVNTLPDAEVAAERVAKALYVTRWCINRKRNMIALPMWGQTVKWYSNIGSAVQTLIKKGAQPPFKDLPQHDIHHNDADGYTSEVTSDIQTVWKTVNKKTKACEFNAEDLCTDLDGLSDKWKEELGVRGIRQGGTHAAWTKAMGDDNFQCWVEPFSMAATASCGRKSFPFRGKAEGKLASIVKAMKGMGVI